MCSMVTKPHVWCNFVVKDKKLRIQDAPSDRIEDVVDLFVTYFATEETVHKVAEIYKSKEALEECKEFVREMVTDTQSIVICCTDDDPNIVGEIVAASLMMVSKKGDPDEDMDFKTRTKEMGRMFEIMDKLFGLYDAMKQLELDSLYDDRGVVVHPSYRGLGIAQKLFNVRRMICKAEGIPVAGAWVTSFGSQKAAERDGWKTVFEVSYEDFGKQFGITFKDVPSSCKFMIARTRTQQMSRMVEIMDKLFVLYDAMKELELDSLYEDVGVVVHPSYRGLGIAQKLFNVKRMICKADGIPVAGAWVTSYGSQKAAERDGWETVYEIPYEEFGKRFGITFKDVPPSCKFMIARAI